MLEAIALGKHKLRSELQMTPRAEEIFNEQLAQIHRSTDYIFAWLLLGQWAFAVILAIVVSPLAWEGLKRAIHLHVWIDSCILGNGYFRTLSIQRISN